ncbi:hypothetical protein QBC34DRAFT_414195 [Podospora aff. communis PSN243]|uniref:Uncharacterized protein n=1 Tax=Podospora aff. communis PSN243 TaxID=3040156 RepID=A0AAV9GCH7_9PEZI|nr:hypothetical protein QBC34DRAFT_414195 [Podospora aff. communis PSN243]
MQLSTFISLTTLLSLTASLPLNINLGAYSPALVVGDGAIEFEGEEAAESTRLAATPLAAPIAAQKAAFEGPILNDNSAHLPIPGERQRFNILEPREPDVPLPGAVAGGAEKEKRKRDLAGFDRALQFAEVALTKGPDIELGTGAHGAGVGIIVDNNQADAAGAGTGVVVIGH